MNIRQQKLSLDADMPLHPHTNQSLRYATVNVSVSVCVEGVQPVQPKVGQTSIR
jgi:hypothetical protein